MLSNNHLTNANVSFSFTFISHTQFTHTHSADSNLPSSIQFARIIDRMNLCLALVKSFLLVNDMCFCVHSVLKRIFTFCSLSEHTKCSVHVAKSRRTRRCVTVPSVYFVTAENEPVFFDIRLRHIKTPKQQHHNESTQVAASTTFENAMPSGKVRHCGIVCL